MRSTTVTLVSRAELPNSIGDYTNGVDELELEDAHSVSPVSQVSIDNIKWLVKWRDLVIGQNIGRGPVGDFYKASFEKKEVATKIFVNQKLKEDDMIRLIGDASVLSKVSHKNLLPCYGLCVEPTRIILSLPPPLSFFNKFRLILERHLSHI
jgi:serine/threonine protein kinase